MVIKFYVQFINELVLYYTAKIQYMYLNAELISYHQSKIIQKNRLGTLDTLIIMRIQCKSPPLWVYPRAQQAKLYYSEREERKVFNTVRESLHQKADDEWT